MKNIENILQPQTKQGHTRQHIVKNVYFSRCGSGSFCNQYTNLGAAPSRVLLQEEPGPSCSPSTSLKQETYGGEEGSRTRRQGGGGGYGGGNYYYSEGSKNRDIR